MILFVNRPTLCLPLVRNKRVNSKTSQSKYFPKRKRIYSELTNTQRKDRHNSEIELDRFEPKRGRYDWSNPSFVANFLSIHEEIPEVRYFFYILYKNYLRNIN